MAVTFFGSSRHSGQVYWRTAKEEVVALPLVLGFVAVVSTLALVLGPATGSLAESSTTPSSVLLYTFAFSEFSLASSWESKSQSTSSEADDDSTYSCSPSSSSQPSAISSSSSSSSSSSESSRCTAAYSMCCRHVQRIYRVVTKTQVCGLAYHFQSSSSFERLLAGYAIMVRR